MRAAMDRPLPLFLRPAYRQALAKRARQLNMGEAEAAAHLLSTTLEPFLDQDAAGEQAKAEKQLLQAVDQLTAAELTNPGWNEHLTAAVFQAIADRRAELYERATVNGER